MLSSLRSRLRDRKLSRDKRRASQRRSTRLSVQPLEDRRLMARVNIDDVFLSVSEPDAGSNPAILTISLDERVSDEVVIEYSTARASRPDRDIAEPLFDFTPRLGALTFAPGTFRQTITLQVLGDLLDEPAEEFDVNISIVSGSVTPGRMNVEVTIIDNDPASASFSIAGATVREEDSGARNALFTVTMTGESGFVLTPSWSMSRSNGAAPADSGEDYQSTSGVLTFTPGGGTQQNVTIPILGDTRVENDEDFFVNLFPSFPPSGFGGINGPITGGPGRGLILDDDRGISISDVTVTETDLDKVAAVFDVTLSRIPDEAVTVDFDTSNVTAKAGEDYDNTGGSLVFAIGQTSQRVTVFVLSDVTDEDDETFRVTLSNAVEGTIQKAVGIGTILDNDPLPEIRISNGSLEEEDRAGPPTRTMAFPVTLSAPSARRITVDAATAPGTASASDFFGNNRAIAIFEPGETSKAIGIVVFGDTIEESDEQFNLTYFNPVNASLPSTVVTGTILDDDARVSINDVSVVEGSAGTKSATFAVSLSGPKSVPVTVAYATNSPDSGTATSDSDFLATSGTLVFAAGVTQLPVTVAVMGDTRAEADETFFVNLSGVTNGQLLVATGTGRIINDDAGGILVTGADAGGQPTVRVFDATQAQRMSFNAYNAAFSGGVRAATGDLNADGVLDIITAPGPGGGPHIKVFDGVNGAELFGFFAYHPDFNGGVFVASGDVNGDGRDDIITAAGAGGGPHVKVFSGADNSELFGFFAYHPNFNGGVYVAAGDVNGDGRADIITGAGAGGGPHVKVISGADQTELFGFFAYHPDFSGGVYVAAGDVNGDGLADIITGAGAGGGPHVKIISGATQAELFGFFAYHPAFGGGVRVGAGDLDGDGLADVLTGPGPGGGPHVRGISGLTQAEISGFFAYDTGFSGGVFVAGPRARRLPSAASLVDAVLTLW